MTTIESKLAANLSKKLQGNKQEVFAVSPILVYNIVVTLIKLYQFCKKTPEEAKIIITAPTSIEEKQIRKAVRKEVGFIEYWKNGDKYYDSIIQTGKEVTIEEIKNASGNRTTAEFRTKTDKD